MPRRLRPRPARGVAAGLVVLLAAGACGGGRSQPKPVASLASSPQAGLAFEAIRAGWRDPDRVSPAALRTMLELFLGRFPDDGLAPFARVILALDAMKLEDLATADAQLASTRTLPAGSAHDLWTVARARRLRLGGDPEAGIDLLGPLVGKNVDPLVRSVFQEELTLAALATHRDYEAISYMDAWLRVSAPGDEKAETIEKVTALVQRLPKTALVGAFQAIRTQRASFGYGLEIERILAARLVQIAMSTGDAELARTLLDAAPEAVAAASDAGTELSELATSRRGLTAVAGRTIGLLLPTESPALRDESADVLRGVTWALGLPRGVRAAAGPTAAPDAGGSPAPETCAPLEPAPEIGEPGPEEGVRLVSRDDAGSADRTEASLDELAGEGAALVIAGLDPETSARAVRWGDSHGVSVIALVPPDPGASEGGQRTFGFVLGESRGSVVRALTSAAPSLASETVAPVVDESELSRYPPQGGPAPDRAGPLTLAPPVPCDIPVARAGDTRFPITRWDRDKTRAWLVSGSPQCSRDVVAELSAAHARGVVGLTLEAAAIMPRAAALRVVTAAAGVLPTQAGRDAREDELRRFTATLGPVDWWTALGHDAATLGRAAVRQLPAGSTSDPHVVSERRAQARDLLASARARLWTTEVNGWGGGRTMKRTVCALEAPPR
jgi:hypothetical protein